VQFTDNCRDLFVGNLGNYIRRRIRGKGLTFFSPDIRPDFFQPAQQPGLGCSRRCGGNGFMNNGYGALQQFLVCHFRSSLSLAEKYGCLKTVGRNFITLLFSKSCAS
jgi:hypothetical protein